MKHVYPLTSLDSIPNVDPNNERKLVLKCSPNNNDNEQKENKTDSEAIVYQDPILKQLLSQDESSVQSNIRKSTHKVRLGYDHYSVDQVLSRILPRSLTSSENLEIPSSFEVVGHCAHLNLREEQWPYKFLIGRIILEKNKSLKIVVNKIGTIQNEYRTFPMECLAMENEPALWKGNTLKRGERCDKLEVEVKEDGCHFALDFAKVYWNSRLQFEHRRLVKLIAGKGKERRKIGNSGSTSKKQGKYSTNTDTSSSNSNEIVIADACAGIGPFAIPLTSQFHKIKVHANDLNPVSYNYLQINGKKNNCPESALKLYQLDARLFLRKLDAEKIKYHHVIMNLPAAAPEFLNVFRGWTGDYDQRPMLHIHCFAGKDDAANDEAIARCSRALGCPLNKESDQVFVHVVRDVSPNKNMLCVSFRLPRGVKNVERVEEFSNTPKDNTENDLVGAENSDVSSPAAKRVRKN